MSFHYHSKVPATASAEAPEPMRHRCAVEFWLTSVELVALTARVNRAGLTAPDYVRTVALNTEPALADLLTAARLTRSLANGIMREQAKTSASRDAAARLAAESTAVATVIERAAAMIGIRLE